MLLEGPWEAARSLEGTFQEWAWCLLKHGPETSHQVKAHLKGAINEPYQKPTLLRYWLPTVSNKCPSFIQQCVVFFVAAGLD